MREQRVVVTGMGAVSPYGEGANALWSGLASGKTALHAIDASMVPGLLCAVGGVAPKVNEKRISRDVRRTMSPMSIHATLAAWEALAQAGLSEILNGNSKANNADTSNIAALKNTLGVSIGSTLGSPRELHNFFAEFIQNGTLDSVRSTVFFKIMGHSVAANVAMACGVHGRLLAPAAACASGLMGIGLGFEAIRYGKERAMLCGGADEFHILTAATFDRMNAASHESEPCRASMPFNSQRNGIAVSEGAGVLLLESLDSAILRGAPILAEITGYASNSSTQSIAQPESESMYRCMERALSDAECTPKDIGYICAHATSTPIGDISEGQALEKLFGENGVPVSSLKGHLGHSLAASGALESIATIQMMQHGTLLPTLHTQNPDPNCGKLDHILAQRTIENAPLRHCLKNAFAMGGINCSLVISAWQG